MLVEDVFFLSFLLIPHAEQGFLFFLTVKVMKCCSYFDVIASSIAGVSRRGFPSGLHS